MPNSEQASAAAFMVGQSVSLPMMIPTSGFACVLFFIFFLRPDQNCSAPRLATSWISERTDLKRTQTEGKSKKTKLGGTGETDDDRPEGQATKPGSQLSRGESYSLAGILTGFFVRTVSDSAQSAPGGHICGGRRGALRASATALSSSSIVPFARQAYAPCSSKSEISV